MLVGSNVRRVAVVGGMRIPFARGHGAYARVGNQDMYTAVLQALVAKYRIAGERLGDVTGGAVLKHSKDFNLVRECVLSSGPGSGDARHRHAARLRHRSRRDDLDGDEDRARPDGRGIAGGSTRSAIRPSSTRANTSSCCCARIAAKRMATHQPLLRIAAETFQTRDARRARAAHRPVDG
jgi:hypothetical protein